LTYNNNGKLRAWNTAENQQYSAFGEVYEVKNKIWINFYAFNDFFCEYIIRKKNNKKIDIHVMGMSRSFISLYKILYPYIIKNGKQENVYNFLEEEDILFLKSCYIKCLALEDMGEKEYDLLGNVLSQFLFNFGITNILFEKDKQSEFINFK
jgi:hypothetical protein